MKRLFIATVALFFIAGVTFWIVGTDPHIDADTMKKIKLVSRFKETLPVAEAGDPKAQFAIGKMYEEGDGTRKDMRQAVNWYMKAADQGFPNAQFQIGWMYANGIGLRQDYAQAARWYRIASTFSHHTEAQYRLGELYYNGRGVEHDYATAIKYYKLAASKGFGAAQYILGSIYIEGWGVNRDLIVAYVWLTLAQANRDAVLAVNKRYDPAKKLKTLLPKMNRFQIEEGEKRLVILREQIQNNIAALKANGK